MNDNRRGQSAGGDRGQSKSGMLLPTKASSTNSNIDQGTTMSLVASAHQRMMMKKRMEKKRAEGRGEGGGVASLTSSVPSGVRSSTTAPSLADSSPAAAAAVASPKLIDGAQRPSPASPSSRPLPQSRSSAAQWADKEVGETGGGGGTGASLVRGTGINSLDTSQPWDTTPQRPRPPPPSSQGMLIPAYYERVALSPDSDYEDAIRPRGKHTNYLSPREAGRVPNRRRRGYDSFVGAPSSFLPAQSTGGGPTKTMGGEGGSPVRVLGDNNDFEYHNDIDEDGTAFDNINDDGSNGFVVDNSDNDEKAIISKVSTDPSHDPWAEENFVDDNGEGDGAEQKDIINDSDNNEVIDADIVAVPPPFRYAESPDNDNQTVDSERVLTGTPVRKKDFFKTIEDGDSMALVVEGRPPKPKDAGKHRKMPKLVMIKDDIVLQYSSNRRTKESKQGERDWEDGGEGDGVPVAHESSVDATVGTRCGSMSSHEMRDIAVDARRMATDSGDLEDDNSPLIEDPPRTTNNSLKNIGLSKSWDSPDVTIFPNSADAFASYGFGSNVSMSKETSFFSSSFWDDGDDDNGTSRTKQQQLSRASKSWDENEYGGQQVVGGLSGVDGAVDNNFGTCGTWGEQSADLFSDIDTAHSGSLFNGIAPSTDNIDDKKGMERGRSDNIDDVTNGDRIVVCPPSLMAQAITKKSHPWNTDQDLENSELDLSVFRSEVGEEQFRSEKSRYASSARGENENEKKKTSSTTRGEAATIPSLLDPEEIFDKINGSLKQADKTKNRALGIEVESASSKDSSYVRNYPPPMTSVVQSSSSMSRSSAASFASEHVEEKMMVKRIKFVSDEENTIHTFTKEKEISEGSPAENEERSDTDTYEDSTIADSITYKSEEVPADDFSILTELRKDVDDAVSAVAAKFGGLFGLSPTSMNGTNTFSPTNGRDGIGEGRGDGVATLGVSRSILTEEDKSAFTDENETNTYDESRSTEQWTRTTGTGTGARTDDAETEASENDWLGYMRRMIFPKDDGTSVRSVGTTDDDYLDGESTYQDEEDNYLLLQALAAARAVHHVQGVEFDEQNEINVLTDIKFVVVTVSLPLGLFFQEHDIGVWVSRAVPSGNGAKQGVQHGDQLAAVNGGSCVHATIDDIASKISRTPNGKVELTFLRYAGPLRPMPGSITQEGFEVTDTARSSPTTNALPKTIETEQKNKRGLFSKKGLATIVESPQRKLGIGIIPKSPRRADRSTECTNPPFQPPVSTEEVPPMPGLLTPTKKKKSLGKMLSFKKKT